VSAIGTEHRLNHVGIIIFCYEISESECILMANITYLLVFDWLSYFFILPLHTWKHPF